MAPLLLRGASLMPRKKIAIVGVGESDFGTVPDKTVHELHAQAVVRAIQDAGIVERRISAAEAVLRFTLMAAGATRINPDTDGTNRFSDRLHVARCGH